MIAARLMLLLALAAWGWLALNGWGGIESIRAQGAPGYPNAEQIRYYLHLPLLASGLCLVLFAASWGRRGGCALAITGAAALAALPAYLIFYTGGV